MLTSNEVQRYAVERQFIVMLAQLPKPLAAELERAVDLGQIDRDAPGLAEMTVSGQLAFRALGRIWHLGCDEDGNPVTQAVVIDEDGTFASTQYQDRVEVGSLLDRLESVQFIDLEPEPGDA